ncbi:Protein of unknown function DUF3293 [uncultured Caudovirales phage]|uniref:Uncharacterized protein n=1 Tax=uncultured Caudovirales phage TaxID=2100421 RepID=A0A6J5MCX8_9CAUD|nr:Protein of unknown function DUF3293 [uncultured Caudovirales phage]
MKHCGPFSIDESSLSRAYQHVVEKKSPSWGMITAYRYANSKKENQAVQKQLEQDIRKMGYGFFKVEGHWQECQDPNINYTDCPKDKLRDSTEESLFVPNIKKEEMEKLCKKYEQDAVIYGDKDNDAHLIYKNGKTENIGKFQPGKISQAYSKVKGGKTFIFGKEEPKKKEEPKTDIFGKKLDTKSDINKLKSMLPKAVLDKTVKNPKTGNTIKVKSALSYDKKSPVFQAAKQLIKKAAN